MTLRLARRERTPELMDQPGLERAAHRQALRGLARTNAWGATRRELWKAIAAMAGRRSCQTVSILDVASGAGDLALWLARKAAASSLELDVSGCDISQVAVDHANAAARDARSGGVRFFRCDILAAAPETTYDIVTCALFLHHLTEEQAVQLLKTMAGLARWGILVDDLDRSTRGYLLAWWGPRLLTRSPIVHVDGPLSVRAAFTQSEALALAAEAGLQPVAVRRHWPQRFLLSWERTL